MSRPTGAAAPPPRPLPPRTAWYRLRRLEDGGAILENGWPPIPTNPTWLWQWTYLCPRRAVESDEAAMAAALRVFEIVKGSAVEREPGRLVTVRLLREGEWDEAGAPR